MDTENSVRTIDALVIATGIDSIAEPERQPIDERIFENSRSRLARARSESPARRLHPLAAGLLAAVGVEGILATVDRIASVPLTPVDAVYGVVTGALVAGIGYLERRAARQAHAQRLERLGNQYEAAQRRYDP